MGKVLGALVKHISCLTFRWEQFSSCTLRLPSGVFSGETRRFGFKLFSWMEWRYYCRWTHWIVMNHDLQNKLVFVLFSHCLTQLFPFLGYSCIPLELWWLGGNRLALEAKPLCLSTFPASLAICQCLSHLLEWQKVQWLLCSYTFNEKRQ